MKKSKFREPGGSKKKKNDAVASGTGEVEKAQLIERPRDYVVTLHFPEVCVVLVCDRLSGDVSWGFEAFRLQLEVA